MNNSLRNCSEETGVARSGALLPSVGGGGFEETTHLSDS